MVAMQLGYVLFLRQQGDKSDAVKLATKTWMLFIGIILAGISTGIVIYKKSNGGVGTGLGYACWLIQGIGLTICAGWAAARVDTT